MANIIPCLIWDLSANFEALQAVTRNKKLVTGPGAGHPEKTGRRGYGIEIDPAYCDVTIRRLRAVCGLEAVLEATGQRFAEVEAERLGGEVR